MAEATKSTRTVTTTEETHTLSMSAAEASWLRDHLAAQPSGAYASALYNALVFPTDGDTFEYKGVTYSLTAKYRDTSSDIWYFTGARNSDGEPLASCEGQGPEYRDWPLSRLTDHYTRLTKI